MDKKTIASAFLMSSWLFLFCTGFLIDSSPFRSDLAVASKAATDSTITTTYTLRKIITPNTVADTMRVVVRQKVVAYPRAETSKQYWQRLRFLVQSFSGTIFTWTPTNIAFLSILAGLIGSIMYLLKFADSLNFHQRRIYFVGGAIQGFAVYLMLISGVFLVTNDPFANVTAAQYVRLAGLVSLASFTCGYKPDLFISLVDNVSPIGNKPK
jgi:hypothetical protein